LNHLVQAEAFTTGTDVFFRSGRYDPDSAGGRELLAHELTHVAQQATGASGAAAWVSHPDDPAEVHARQVARSLRDTGGWPTAQRQHLTGQLQAAAGNAAVAGSMQIHRYDAYEHATEGDRVPGSRTATAAEREDIYTGQRSGGVQLTSGEIDALADLYGSPEELYRADPTELRRLLVLIHQQQRDPRSVSESDWDDATGGRYNRLNLRNSAHFGPSDAALVPVRPGGGSASNRERFLQYYNETIVNGQEAYHFYGLPDPEQTRRKLDQATISAGFAEHYIMDAFSAGHLFNKDDFVEQVRQHLNALSKDQISHLFSAVAARVLADPRARALLGHYEPTERPLGGWLPFRPNFDHEYAFKALLEKLYEDAEGRQA